MDFEPRAPGAPRARLVALAGDAAASQVWRAVAATVNARLSLIKAKAFLVFSGMRIMRMSANKTKARQGAGGG